MDDIAEQMSDLGLCIWPGGRTIWNLNTNLYLLKESIEALQIKPDGIYVDGTLGGGGHSYEICRHLSG